MSTHEKIITELKGNLHKLDELEKRCNMPQSTLSHAISGRRKIPTKYLDLLIKELKL
jgi:predicted transcriptional regulator